jgi:hypothetical protein
MSEVKNKLVSPIGTVKFTKTIIKDKTYTTLIVPNGYEQDDTRKDSWSFVLTLDPKDLKVKELLSFLDSEHKKIKKANFLPYKNDKAKNENDEIVETGFVAINFKSNFAPAIVDAKRNPCHEQIGWGSKVAVAFTVKPVDSQCKIGLGRYGKAIQVIELAQAKTDYGFAEEEGYTAPDPVALAAAGSKGYISTSDEIAWDDDGIK